MAKLPAKDTKPKSPVTQAKSTPSKTAKASPATTKGTRRAGKTTTGKAGAEAEAETQAANAITDADADADEAAAEDADSGEQTVAGKPKQALLKPHDRYYGRVMNRPQDAKALLRSAMGEDMAALLDWSVWELQNGTFIDESLKGRYTDVLYRTRTLDDEDAFLFVLAEHQSTIDPLMAYRMVEYIIKIWSRYLQTHPNAKKLPLVVPLVVHSNGVQVWNAARDIGELINLGPRGREVFAQVIPRWQYLLDDIARQDLEKLRARGLPNRVLVMLVAHKVGPKNPDVVADLRPITGELVAVVKEPGGHEEGVTLISYLAAVSDSDPDALQEFAREISDEVKEAMMTTAQRMQAKMRVELRVELRLEMHVEMLLDQLRAKFGELPEVVVQAVHEADDEQVLRWLMLVVTDTTLGEMFALTAV